MGEEAKKAADHFKNLKKPLRYRAQDGSQASPESLPLQQGNELNNTIENTNFETKRKLLMNDKPMIQCPHCNQVIEADSLVSHRMYRNEYGLDIFECPDCNKNYKIEPREYLDAREGIEKGNLQNTHVIKAARIDEILPSEKKAINYDRRPRAPWRGPIKFIAVIVFLIIVFSALN